MIFKNNKINKSKPATPTNIKLKKKQIVVGVSGGVDSSVTIGLLKKEGWDVFGLFLKIPVWVEKENKFTTNHKSIKDQENIAKKVCKKLNVPFFTKDLCYEFETSVINYFLNSYKNTKTPNPCAYCNRFFKFKYLFDFANSKNIEFVSTGHYANIIKKNNNYYLQRGKDLNKDQTYGLCLLKKENLSRIHFPLGKYTKKEVYKFSQKLDLSIFKKEKQSQDICFLKNSSLKNYIKSNIDLKSGEILDSNSKVLGIHKGLPLYTIGQRRGLALNQKSYVSFLDIKNNKLIVTNNSKNVVRKEIFITNLNLLVSKEELIKNDQNLLFQTRYSQKPIPGNIYFIKNKIKVVFDKNCKFVTQGQFCVIYRKDICLGGGEISYT